MSARKLNPTALSVLLTLVIGSAALQAQAAIKTVNIIGEAFSPQTVTIGAGDSVRWVNYDFVVHDVTSDTGAWSTPAFSYGQSASITFSTPGTNTYYCALHPFMRGTVIVLEPPGSVTLLAPAAGAELANSDALEFSWSEANPAATWYHVWVTRNGMKYREQWIGGATVWNPAEDFAGGNYTWWVRGWNGVLGPWSSAGQFTIFTNAPGQITLISPLGTTENSATIDYTWQADASASWYELYVLKDNSLFLDRWYFRTNLAPNGAGDLSAQATHHGAGSYRWWVRAWSVDGLGPWSAAGSFTRQSQGEPGPVTLFTPADGATVGNAVDFTWSETEPAAAWYFFWINQGNTIFFRGWTQTNFFRFSNGLSTGNYTWRVRPWNESGFGSWSQGNNFNVQGGIPLQLTLVSPVGTTESSPVIDYTWVAAPSATWYQLYVNQNGSLFLNRWFNLNDLSFLGGNNLSARIPNHPTGNYTWWVRGWSPDGTGPWSAAGAFTRTSP